MVADKANRATTVAGRLGWIAIVLSVIILLVFGTIRLADMSEGSSSNDAFGIRYVQNP